MPFFIDADKNIEYGTGLAGTPFSTEAELAEFVAAQGLSKEGVTEIWNSFAGVVPFHDLNSQKCFRNRPYGIAAIWKAIQRLASSELAAEEKALAHTFAPPSGVPDAMSHMVHRMDETGVPAAVPISETLAGYEPVTVAHSEEIGDTEKMNKLKKRDGLRTKRKGLAAKVKEAVAKKAKKGPRAKKIAKPKGEHKERGHREGTKRARLIEMMERKNGVSLDEAMDDLNWLRHTCRGAISTLGSKGLNIVTSKEEKRGMVYRVAS